MDEREIRKQRYRKMQSAWNSEQEIMDDFCTYRIPKECDSATAKAHANAIQDQLKVIDNLENEMRAVYYASSEFDGLKYFLWPESDSPHRRIQWQKALVKLNQLATSQEPPAGAVANVAAELEAMKTAVRDLSEKMKVCMESVLKQQKDKENVEKIADAADDDPKTQILEILQKLSAEQEAIKASLDDINEKL